MKRLVISIWLIVIIVGSALLFKEVYPTQKVVIEKINHEKIQVALSQADSLNSWKIAQINSLIDSLSIEDIEVIYHEPIEYSLQWQLEDLRQLIELNPDYLVLIPRQRKGYEEILLLSKEREIPIILVEQDVEMSEEYGSEDYYEAYIAGDYYKEGLLCAEILAQHFQNKSCNALIIQGDKASMLNWNRYWGFIQGVRKYPNLYIEQLVEGENSRLVAQKLTELAIADKDIAFNTVVSFNDEDGLGVLNALKLAGNKEGQEVVLISINGVQDVVKAIITGEYFATIQSNTKIGPVVLKVIRELEAGETPDKKIFMDNKIINSKNAREMLSHAY